MQEVIQYRQQIRSRLAEKRKFSSARAGIAWLLMIVSGLVMLTLLRISILFVDKALAVPPVFIAILPVVATALYALWKAGLYIKKNELSLASIFVLLAMTIAAFSLLLLIAGIYQWYVELRHMHRFTAGGFILVLLFYMFNVVIAFFNLLSVYKKLRTYQVHSMNMDSFNKTFHYWTFLFVLHAIFVLTVTQLT